MDPAEQIGLLRREHEAAVEIFDFKRAKTINKQIEALRKTMENKSRTNKVGRLDLELDEREEDIKGQWERQKAQLMQDQADLQAAFNDRYHEIQAEHTEKLRQLTLRQTIALEREASRPVVEAEAFFERSKTCARAQKYEQAEEAFREGTRIKEQAMEQRIEACNARYTRGEARIKEDLERELALLTERQEAAMREHNLKLANHDAILERKRTVGLTKKATEAARPRELVSFRKQASSVRGRSAFRDGEREVM
jgi:hypothetical protein